MEPRIELTADGNGLLVARDLYIVSLKVEQYAA